MANTSTNNQFRPPIVAVMGHIDHGKTSLLDKIRSSNVTAREAGGITQHISSYQLAVKRPEGDRIITFIDTPGHAAFNKMRSRGAQVTDIVILVVAATEGVMPQTKESIQHIKISQLPVIIAMNKMDLEGASPEKVKGQLVELELTPEEYGGQVPLIPVSAKTGLGIDTLMDEIFLHADIMELKNEPDASLQAVIIESRLDSARGPVANLIIKKGTLHLGESIYAESIACKVKAMIDSTGQHIKLATPSMPVEVLGFEAVPPVGALVTLDRQPLAAVLTNPNLDGQSSSSDDPKMNIVVKADTQGTLEALKNSVASDDIIVISSGIGPVSDNDVFLAANAQATIYAFNVKTPGFIAKLADNEKVPIFESKIIYEIIEDIQGRVLKMLEPTIDETITGEAKIIAEFKIDKTRIAGISCNKGEIKVGDSVHLAREGKIIKDTKVEGIRQGKSIVDRLKLGNEAGMTFKPYVDFKVNDVIIAYNK